jgi:hypothetical protein
MPDIDFALGYQFVDAADGVPRQLRFQCNQAPIRDDQPCDDSGQLIAIVADARRPDNGHTLAISRPNVTYRATRAALCGWQTWAKISETVVNLAEIRRRIHAAHLD